MRALDLKLFRDLTDHCLRRALDGRENVGEAIAVIIGDPRLLQRAMRPDSKNDRRHATTDNHGDRKDLGPEASDVSKELDVKRRHRFTK